jgi:predicted P-loop ATPase
MMMSTTSAKPVVFPVNVENIPTEMQAMPHWLAWHYEYKAAKNKGKWTKTPYDPMHMRKSQTGVTTFDNALNGYRTKKFDGIGFQLTDSGLVCIDIDHCLDEEGNPNDLAARILSKAPHDTYIEKSPSHRGLHIWGRGVKQNDRCKEKTLDIEIYDKSRYITVTGDMLPDYKPQIGDIQAAIDCVHDLMDAARPSSPSVDVAPVVAPIEEVLAATPGKSFLTDSEVLDKIFKNTRPHPRKPDEPTGSVFRRFYEEGYTGPGDVYDSQSEADEAFMGQLRFYTNADPEQMEAIFCTSALYRPEKKGGYVERTVKSVLDDPNWDRKTYQPNYGHLSHPQKGAKGKSRYKKAANLERSEKGRPLKTWENINLILEVNGYNTRLNELSHQLKIYQGEKALAIKPDDFAVDLAAMCQVNGITTSPESLIAYIKRIGYEHRFNPWKDYLDTAWERFEDKHKGSAAIPDMINALMECLIFEPTANVPLSRVLLTKWAVQACYLAANNLEDGLVSPQGILVIQGPQGIGKTHLLYALAPSKDMVQEGVRLEPRDKDSVMEATSYALVELGELARTMKGINALKAFFTRPKDTYRVPYGRATNEYPRLTSYIGTTNDDKFLKDETGDRRYWVIELQDIDRAKLNKTVKAIDFWGYAMHLAYEEGYDYRLTSEERADIEGTNAAHRIVTNEEQALEDVYNWDSPRRNNLKTSTEIANQLQNYGCRQAKNTTVGRILSKWVKKGKHDLTKQMKHGQGSKWFYAMPSTVDRNEEI